MNYFTNEKTISAIKRQVYSGNLSSFTTVGTASCYLRPLNEEQSAANGFQYGQGFSMIVECAVDIREGDKVTVSSTDYTVRGVVNHDRGNYTSYKRCLLLLPEAL